MDPMDAGGKQPPKPRQSNDPSNAGYSGGAQPPRPAPPRPPAPQPPYVPPPTPPSYTPPPPSVPPTAVYQQPSEQPPAPPPPGKSKNKLPLIIAATIVVLALVAGGLVLGGVFKSDDESSSTAQGEVFLAPAADVGPDPFTEDPPAEEPDPTVAEPAAATSTVINAPSTGSTQTTSYNGASPGLYGGTQNESVCDRDLLVKFLQNNRDKATAWVAALNADPNVKLPDGSALAVDSIPQYVATLTPVILQYDTRVTNHGYANGKPTVLQSVLQKGNAVLVDDQGVPRVRCYCGNPLLPPVPTKTKPVFKGKTWPGFNPGQVAVVQPSPTKIKRLILKNLKTGALFNRPVGTTGKKDTKNQGTATSAPPPSSTPPPPSSSGSTTPPATTAMIDAKTFTVADPNGWQKQVVAITDDPGAYKLRYASDVANYGKHFNDTTGAVYEGLTINVAKTKTYDDLVKAKKLTKFITVGGSDPGTHVAKCDEKRKPFSGGGFSGVIDTYGPCLNPGFSDNQHLRIDPYKRKQVTIIAQRPSDGAVVTVVLNEKPGNSSVEALAANMLGTLVVK